MFYQLYCAILMTCVRGLYDVIHPSWFFMFSPPELQVLIAGAHTQVSVEDLKQNTRYSGGFHPADRRISCYQYPSLNYKRVPQDSEAFLGCVRCFGPS
jgi:hypothetical protein